MKSKKPYLFELVDRIEILLYEIIADMTEFTSSLFSARLSNKTLYNIVCDAQKVSFLSEPFLITALIYMDRLVTKDNRKFTKASKNNIFSTCLLLAMKMLDDECCENKEFAAAWGVKIDRLNEFEREVLNIIEFDLVICEEDYKEYWKIAKDLL